MADLTPGRRDTIAPSRFVADCNDTTPTYLGSGSADEGRLVRLTDGGQATAFGGRGLHFLHDVPGSIVALGFPIKHRNLTDRRGHFGIRCCRGKCVAAARRGAERRDACAIDFRQGTGKCDGGAPVIQLTGRFVQVGLASAVTKASIVENQRRDTCGCKVVGESVQTVSACSGQAVSHHDDGSRTFVCRGRVEPRCARITA